MEAAVASPDRSPVERLLSLGEATREVGNEPYERDLIEVLHRPENRAAHDRMSERILARLVLTLASIIADGVADGSFNVRDPSPCGVVRPLHVHLAPRHRRRSLRCRR